MQVTAIAIAISAVLGGAVGAGATALTFSYASTAPVCSGGATDAMKNFSQYRPVPTTGSKGF